MTQPGHQPQYANTDPPPPTGGSGLKPLSGPAELQRQIEGYRYHLDQCEQIAGKALGYPWFKDDQKNFPGATEANGVCIGDHVGDSIVEELARAYEAVKAERDILQAAMAASTG